VSTPTATDGLRRIVEHRALDDRHRLLEIEADPALAGFAPGQFVMVDCGGGLTLRRPFSIQRRRIREEGTTIEILYRVVGRGTRAMADLAAGGEVWVLGPLGQPFTLPSPDHVAVLLGGGVGIPPMVALAEAIRGASRVHPHVVGGISGVRDRSCLAGLRELPGPLTVATLDGSEGVRGTVLDAMDTLVAPAATHVQLYACGPIPMLVAVAERARERGWPCQVSVEALMGCGYGACVGCAVPRSTTPLPANVPRWALACKEGPVFGAEELDLAGMEEPGR